jgi:hypothetical protein
MFTNHGKEDGILYPQKEIAMHRTEQLKKLGI